MKGHLVKELIEAADLVIHGVHGGRIKACDEGEDKPEASRALVRLEEALRAIEYHRR
jgi:hypothetical protein